MTFFYKQFIFYLFFTLFTFCVKAQPAFYFNYAQFYLDNTTPYTEFYIRIPSSGLQSAKEPKNQTAALINMEIKQQEQIVYQEEYLLQSPSNLKGSKDYDLIDLKRIPLAPNSYQLHLKITDAEDTSSRNNLTLAFKVPPLNKDIIFSDIILLDTFQPSVVESRFSKSGFQLIPSVTNVVALERNMIYYYAEIYNQKSTQEVRLKQTVLNAQGKPILYYEKIRKKILPAQLPIIDGIESSKLSEGLYTLLLQVLDKDGNVLATQSMDFSKMPKAKNNQEEMFLNMPLAAITDLREYLEPISEEHERMLYDAHKAKKDSMALKHWFYNFWNYRDSIHPLKAYMDYLEVLVTVQKNFSTTYQKGYKTDRGRVYIQYGKPNSIVPVHDESEAFPYEIWTYSSAGKQTNVKFVFYNPTAIDNDFVIINSTMRGEIKNPQWKKMIYKRTNKNTQLDQDVVPDNYGNKLNERIKE